MVKDTRDEYFRLRKLRLLSLGKRRLHGNLTATFQHGKGKGREGLQ